MIQSIATHNIDTKGKQAMQRNRVNKTTSTLKNHSVKTEESKSPPLTEEQKTTFAPLAEAYKFKHVYRSLLHGAKFKKAGLGEFDEGKPITQPNPIQEQSKNNLRALIHELKQNGNQKHKFNLRDDEILLFQCLLNAPFRLQHATNLFYPVLSSGSLKSYEELKRDDPEYKSEFSTKGNIKGLNNDGFVYFRGYIDPVNGDDTRYGFTKLQFDLQLLRKCGWISLRDQLKPLSTRNTKTFYWEKRLLRTVQEVNINNKAKDRTLRDGLLYHYRKTPINKKYDSGRKDPFKVVAQSESISCTRSFLEEIFYGKDILLGIALSVIRELRHLESCGFREDFLTLLEKQKSKRKINKLLGKLVKDLFRIEGKYPVSLKIKESKQADKASFVPLAGTDQFSGVDSQFTVINPDGDGRYNRDLTVKKEPMRIAQLIQRRKEIKAQLRNLRQQNGKTKNESKKEKLVAQIEQVKQVYAVVEEALHHELIRTLMEVESPLIRVKTLIANDLFPKPLQPLILKLAEYMSNEGLDNIIISAMNYFGDHPQFVLFIRALINIGADVNSAIKFGINGSKINVRETLPIFESIKLRNIELIQLFIDNDAMLENVYDEEGNSICMAAAHDLQLLRLLVANGADLDEPDSDEITYLIHESIQTENQALFEFLLQSDVDLTVRNNDDLTPLDLALEKKVAWAVEGIIKREFGSIKQADSCELIEEGLTQIVISGDDHQACCELAENICDLTGKKLACKKAESKDIEVTMFMGLREIGVSGFEAKLLLDAMPEEERENFRYRQRQKASTDSDEEKSSDSEIESSEDSEDEHKDSQSSSRHDKNKKRKVPEETDESNQDKSSKPPYKKPRVQEKSTSIAPTLASGSEMFSMDTAGGMPSKFNASLTQAQLIDRQRVRDKVSKLAQSKNINAQIMAELKQHTSKY